MTRPKLIETKPNNHASLEQKLAFYRKVKLVAKKGQQFVEKKTPAYKANVKETKARLEKLKTGDLEKDKTAVGFDGCPVSHIIALALQDGRDHGIVFGIISGDRRDGVAQKFGKSSQLQLWNLYQSGQGNPANPPGSSTHEYVNGGNGGTPAYHTKFAEGETLPAWCLGLDLRSNSEATLFIAAMKKIGYDIFQPYQSGSELHHVCFASSPLNNLRKRKRI